MGDRRGKKRALPLWFIPLAVLVRLAFWAYLAATVVLVLTGGFEGWW